MKMFFRFEVSVNDPASVCGGEPVSDLERVVERFAGRKSDLCKFFAQGAALEEFGDEVRVTVYLLPLRE
jgi:hypothetical protein